MGGNFDSFLEFMIEDKMQNIYQGAVGRIESFDTQTMRADVEILLQTRANIDSDEVKDIGIIGDIPVNYIHFGDYYIRPEYKKDDLVWVGFSSFDFDASLDLTTQPNDTSFSDITNCVVISGLAKKNFSAPNSFSESGLIVGYKETYLQVNENDIKIVNSAGGQLNVNDNFTVDI